MRMQDTVRVRLSPLGFDRWRAFFNEGLGVHALPLSYFTNQRDRHGYVSFVLWDLLRTFGPVITGEKPVYILDILPTHAFRFSDWGAHEN